MISCSHIEHQEEMPAVYKVTLSCNHTFQACLKHLVLAREYDKIGDVPCDGVIEHIIKIEGISEE